MGFISGEHKKNYGVNMQKLPPLNALRAFEVAARTGSFVQAGAELGVTAAAVSQQVKTLETHLGKQLFQRQGNRIILTDAGRTVYPRVEQAFSDIASMSAMIREGQTRAQLVVSVLPSMAELWLMPRLAKFQADVSVEIRVEDDPVAFSREGVDLRLTYGAALYPDFVVQALFTDQIVPVCSPAFLLQLIGGITALPDNRFIHTDWGPAYAAQHSWSAWMAAARLSRFSDPTQGLRVAHVSMAIAAAREGIGVALVPERIAAGEIKAGRLAIASDIRLELPSPYVLIYPNALARKKPLAALVAHLRACA
jgi:LysR family transcriptional regulator, glycine cleavage system transcriptional activator